MLTEGTRVKIYYSRQLQDWQLLFLASQSGKVTQLRVKGTRSPGAFILITDGTNKGEEWFVPIQSLRTKEGKQKRLSSQLLETIKIR